MQNETKTAVPVGIAGATKHVAAVVGAVWFRRLGHDLPSNRWQAPVQRPVAWPYVNVRVDKL